MKYRILAVRDDGHMMVEWENGPTIAYPVPEDGAGDVLDAAALEDWLADQYINDIEPRTTRPNSRLDGVRAMVRQPTDPFVDITAKVNARKAARGP